MLLKIIILLFVVFILYSLGTALYFLVQDRSKGTRVVKALTIRIGLSLALFILICVAYKMGWISPHGV